MVTGYVLNRQNQYITILSLVLMSKNASDSDSDCSRSATEIFATLGYWLWVGVTAGLFAVYVQLTNISIIDMHINYYFTVTI